jgi:hypothetical protein
MSADNRIVVFKIRGCIYAREVRAWSDLLSPNKGTAWEKAQQVLQFPGPLLRDVEQAIQYTQALARAITAQSDQLEYPEPLCVEFDPDNKVVREFTLADA